MCFVAACYCPILLMFFRLLHGTGAIIWLPLCQWSNHEEYCDYGTVRRDIKMMQELPWITIFGSWVRRFAKDFHKWRSHEWKSLATRIKSDPKIIIHRNKCIIIFLTCYFMSWTHNSAKNNHPSLISQLLPRTVVSDLALWCRHSGSVTSRECEILA